MRILFFSCHVVKCCMGVGRSEAVKMMLYVVPPGPCCFGFRHRDHQTSTEVPRRRDRPDNDDLLHDRRTGEFYYYYLLLYFILYVSFIHVSDLSF